MTSKYKLYYFNGRWAAEPTRLVFAAAGVPYEDIRVSDTDWATRKSGMFLRLLNFSFDYSSFNIAEFAFGQLPVLEVDGVRINQSRVICAYVAKQLGVLLLLAYTLQYSDLSMTMNNYALLRKRCFCSVFSSRVQLCNIIMSRGKTLHYCRAQVWQVQMTSSGRSVTR